MRRSWLLTSAVVALAAGPVAPPTTAPATAPTSRPAKPLAEFASGEYGCAVKYPADWVVPEHPIDGQVFSVRTPALPTTRPTPTTTAATKPADAFGTVGLRVVSEPDAAGDAAVLKDVSAALVTYVVNHGGQHVVLKPDDTAGLPARRLRFETPGDQGPPTSVMTVVIVHRRTAYVFAFAAPTDAFETLKPDFDAIVKSFVVSD